MVHRSNVPLIRPDAEVRPVDGWEGLYAVAADGRVWSMPRAIVDGRGISRRIRGRWLKAKLDGKGYSQVGLHRDGVTQLARIHRLVAMAWLPPPAPGQTQINHKDRIRANPAASNLEWCTASENQLHGWTNVDRKLTDKARAALQLAAPKKRRLTEDQAATIRTRVASGEMKAYLAREFNVSPGTIANVANGRSYRQTTGETRHAP